MKGFIKDEIPSRWDGNQMTHDELLGRIDEIHNDGADPGMPVTKAFRSIVAYGSALRAVVQMHKNYRLDGIYYECSTCGKSTTPCQTIQAIEKELS